MYYVSVSGCPHVKQQLVEHCIALSVYSVLAVSILTLNESSLSQVLTVWLSTDPQYPKFENYSHSFCILMLPQYSRIKLYPQHPQF